MAAVEGLASTFKKLKEPNRENTLQLVYRAEVLFQAKSDAEKIMKFVAIAFYDETKVQNIIDTGSIKKEDQLFISKRLIFLTRITAQQKIFSAHYKQFDPSFIFKGQPLKEYILTQLTRINYCKKEMDKIKQSNPELAAAEDAREIPIEKQNTVSRQFTREISSKDKFAVMSNPRSIRDEEIKIHDTEENVNADLRKVGLNENSSSEHFDRLAVGKNQDVGY